MKDTRQRCVLHRSAFRGRELLVHVAGDHYEQNGSYFFVKRISSFFANSLCLHAHATLAFFRTAGLLTTNLKSTVGRQKVRDCADDSTLGMHASRVGLQN